jgi:RNA polymerase sigma-70 factor, ECF subfamily
MRHRSRHAATIRDRHREHDALVLAVLAKEGVPPAEVEEAAQEVWLTVYRKLTGGEPEPTSWPAYLTTLAQGRAVNHRRAANHRRTASLNEAPDAIAPQLSAERMLLLYGLLDAIPNLGQREAVRLRVEGHSVKEIAKMQSISEAAVRKRLQMASEHIEEELKRDDGKEPTEKAGAFWGFGSFEELLDALSEDRERRWRDIETAIRKLETPLDQPSSGPKNHTAPTIPLLPLIPPTAPGLLATAGKWTLFSIVAGGAFLGGTALGTGRGTPQRAVVIVACPDMPVTTVAPPLLNSLSSMSALPAGTARSAGLLDRPAPGMPPAPTEEPASLLPGEAEPTAARSAAPDDLEGLLHRAKEDRDGARP